MSDDRPRLKEGLGGFVELRTAISEEDFNSAQRFLEDCESALPAMTQDLIALEAALGIAHQCLAVARSHRQQYTHSLEGAERVSHYVDSAGL